jgi:hypothetical protein
MSSPTSLDPDPVADVLGLLEAAADQLDTAEFWRLRGPVLAEVLDRFESVLRRLAFGQVRVLAEFDAQDVAGEQAGLSTEAFLRARMRLSPGEARARVRAAQELVGAVSVSGELLEPALPATAAAAGVLSAEHVRVIAQAIDHLPAGVDPVDRADAEEFLAEQSRDMDPSRIRLLARRLHAVLDPDGTLEDDRPARRELVFRRDIGGMDYLRGRLDPEASATVQAALGALAQPEPAHDGQPDSRSGSRRMADALVSLCDHALTSGRLPAVGGEKPHVTVTIALNDLRGDPTARPPADGPPDLRGAADPHRGATGPEPRGAADPRRGATAPELRGPAISAQQVAPPDLCDAATSAQQVAAAGRFGARTSAGPAAQRTCCGTLGTGVAITAEAARRIACDAAIIPIVLGSQSEPLDIGRATRTVPAGIRRAVVARDIGCIHPGCSAPAAWCQTHHVQHWADGGETSLANLVLLCHHHHWIVHHDNWQITFLNGIPHVIPPPIIDPHQQPKRNTMHDQPGLPSG